MSVTYDALSDETSQFEWKNQPLAARWVTRVIDALAAQSGDPEACA